MASSFHFHYATEHFVTFLMNYQDPQTGRNKYIDELVSSLPEPSTLLLQVVVNSAAAHKRSTLYVLAATDCKSRAEEAGDITR